MDLEGGKREQDIYMRHIANLLGIASFVVLLWHDWIVAVCVFFFVLGDNADKYKEMKDD